MAILLRLRAVSLWLGLSTMALSIGCKSKDSSTPGSPNAGATFTGTPVTTPQVTPSSTQPASVPAAANPGACTSAASCTPARQDAVAATTNGKLIGYVGQVVTWQIFGRDLNTVSGAPGVAATPPSGLQSSVRRVMVLVGNLPGNAQLNPPLLAGSLSSQVAILWTPPNTGTGTLQLLLRDYDRCLVTESVKAVCDGTAPTAYDLPTSVPFEIVVNNGGSGATSTNNSGAFVGSLIGGAVSSLINGLSKNDSGGGGGGGYSYSGQTYPNCRNNNGQGYGCNWQCGNLWCSKDNSDLNDGSICTVTRAGGPSCN